MDPKEAVNVVFALIVIAGVVSIVWEIHDEIKGRHHPGSYSSHNYTPSTGSSHHKVYTTVDGPFGDKVHFDGNGDYAGTSVPSAIDGSVVHFDANGNYAGRSEPGLFAGQVYHTDADGNYVGQSSPGLFGTTIHAGKNGEIGVTDDGAFGGKVTDIDPFDN